MPLQLHPNCQSQLRASLAEQLAHAEVQHGIFLSAATSSHILSAEKSLPQSGKQHDSILDLLGEAPLVDFVNGVLSRELQESQNYQSEASRTPLSSVLGYGDLPKLADRLATAFESLPWQYALTIQLPESFSAVFGGAWQTFEVTKTIRIVCGSHALSESFPLLSGIEKRDEEIAGGSLGGLLLPVEPKWKPEFAYLQVEVEGFVGKYGATETLRRAFSLFRSFFGLGVALELFKPSQTHQPYPLREKAFIHRYIANRWEIEDVHEFDARHSDVIRELQLNYFSITLDDEGKRASWMADRLQLISRAFSAGDLAKNILLGSQWLLDSLAGEDELLQFVQAAVVLEILLGHKASSEQTGLGVLLANRCAYLIASTHRERTEVLRDFGRIYDVRSNIVHAGKSRLLLNERALFDKLRWICRRIIQEEVNLIARTTP